MGDPLWLGEALCGSRGSQDGEGVSGTGTVHHWGPVSGNCCLGEGVLEEARRPKRASVYAMEHGGLVSWCWGLRGFKGMTGPCDLQ